MSKDISKKERQLLRTQFDIACREAEKQIATMASVLDSTGDKKNSLKLKQALLSFRVVYNRARLKLET